MDDMQILKELFRDDAIIPLKKNYDKYKVKLAEPQCSDSSVEIGDIPENSLVLKIDQFPDTSAIFNGNNGECKRADYAIISEYNNKKRILVIELKKTGDRQKNIIKQLWGAYFVVKYCQEIGKHFWNKKDFLNGFDHRFISFRHTSIRKRRTRITRQSATHNTPEKMMKIDWPANIRFNHLAGA